MQPSVIPRTIDAIPSSRKIFAWLFVLGIGAAAMWQVHHFQFSSGFDLFPGPRGDTRQSLYLIEHWYQALSGRAELLSPAMFYPVKATFGFADLFLVYVPGYSLLRFLGYDLFLAAAFTIVVFSFLNFFSCFVLLRNVLKRGVLASVPGALFFAFNNPKLLQTDHLQLQPVFLLPTVVGLLLVFFIKNRSLSERKAFILLASAGAALDVQLLSSFYYGWFLLVGLALFVFLSLLFTDTRLFLLGALTHHRRAVMGAALVLLLGFLPFIWVYWPALRSTGWYGLIPEYIPEIKSFFLTADNNYVWGGLTAFILADSSGPDWGRRLGIGLIPSMAWLSASAYSLWLIWKKSRSPQPPTTGDKNNTSGYDLGYLFLALMILATDLFYIIGFQYRGHTLWKLVYLLVPGGRAIRAIARYVIVLALPMAVAFSFMVQHGIRAVAERKSIHTRAFAGIALFVVVTFGIFEQLNSGEGQYYSIRVENARIDRLASKLPDDCAVFYVAPQSGDQDVEFGEQNAMHDAMLISIKRHVPTINGRSAKYPAGWSLRNITATDYEAKVQQWIQQHRISGKVCRLEIN